MASMLACMAALPGAADFDASDACMRPETPLLDEPSFCLSPCDADDSPELAQLLARCEHDVFACLPAFRWEESDVEAPPPPAAAGSATLGCEPEAEAEAVAAASSHGCPVQGVKTVRPPFSHRNGGPCDHCGVKESPQWRRGPSHKPVLCNACGTRYRRTNQLGPVTPRPGVVARKRGLQNMSPAGGEPAPKAGRFEAVASEAEGGHHLVAPAVEGRA